MSNKSSYKNQHCNDSGNGALYTVIFTVKNNKATLAEGLYVENGSTCYSI
jgi:hypothetical protein